MKFEKYFNKCAFFNNGADSETINYAENKKILTLIKQINNNEYEMEELIFHDL